MRNCTKGWTAETKQTLQNVLLMTAAKVLAVVAVVGLFAWAGSQENDSSAQATLPPASAPVSTETVKP